VWLCSVAVACWISDWLNQLLVHLPPNALPGDDPGQVVHTRIPLSSPRRWQHYTREIWPTVHMVELRLTAGSRPWNGDDHLPTYTELWESPGDYYAWLFLTCYSIICLSSVEPLISEEESPVTLTTTLHEFMFRREVGLSFSNQHPLNLTSAKNRIRLTVFLSID